MKLLGWHQDLPQDIVDAVLSGQLTIIKVRDKSGEYELLQGKFKRGHMTICFK